MFNNNSVQEQYGFTLIEVMVSLLIFMVIALGLAKMEVSAVRSQSENLFRDEAMRLAQEELNRLRGLQFSVSNTAVDLNQTVWNGPVNVVGTIRGNQIPFAQSVQITDLATSAVPLKRIDVAIGWNQGNSQIMIAPTARNHQTSLSTILVRAD